MASSWLWFRSLASCLERFVNCFAISVDLFSGQPMEVSILAKAVVLICSLRLRACCFAKSGNPYTGNLDSLFRFTVFAAIAWSNWSVAD